MKQQTSEPVDTYLTRLKVQAQKCNFSTPSGLEDSLIDQLIKGVVHLPVQKKLLDYDPRILTLDKALDLARTFEVTQLQLQQLGHTGNVPVDQVG